MNGKPPLADCTLSSDCSAAACLGRSPHAASPCAAIPVLLVSGPVNVSGSAAAHAVVVLARYDCHKPFAHCCFFNQVIPAVTHGLVATMPAALSAASASPWRNAPSKVGSCTPKSPLSVPVVRAVA